MHIYTFVCRSLIVTLVCFGLTCLQSDVTQDGDALNNVATSRIAEAGLHQHSDDPPRFRHLLRRRYNADGSEMHGLYNEIVSANWSGYGISTMPPYTAASGSWYVPQVSYSPISTSSSSVRDTAITAH
jgi:hypothetical protein